MEFRDAEISQVVVVLDDDGEVVKFDALILVLQEHGVSVDTKDADNGVIEGTVEAARVKTLEKLPGIKYVRSVFTYVADYPVGDPRNLDETNREDERIPR